MRSQYSHVLISICVDLHSGYSVSHEDFGCLSGAMHEPRTLFILCAVGLGLDKILSPEAEIQEFTTAAGGLSVGCNARHLVVN